MKDCKIPVVLSTDHNYVMPCGVTIASLLMSDNNNSYHFYVIIADDVNEHDKRLLAKQVDKEGSDSEISFMSTNGVFDKGFEIRGISKACYFRLLIPWLLPEYDKVIYCDVDMIFRHGLQELYNVDLSDNYVAGVSTPGFIKNRRARSYISKKLNIEPTEYINSGLLLINSKLQRELNLRDQYLNLSSKKFRYQDQDIINLVGKGKIKLLPDRYNVMPSMVITGDDNVGKTESPDANITCVIHYAGPKPWQVFTCAWLEWWSVWRKSVFYDYEYYRQVSKRAVSRIATLKRWIREAKYKFLG